MPIFEKIVLGILLPILWDISNVVYAVYEARKGKLSARKFTIVFVLSFGLTVSLTLFFAIITMRGFDLFAVGFALLILLINVLIGFPVVYFVTRKIYPKDRYAWALRIAQK